jgi:xanthine dehydrogenase accessory factor
MLDLLEEIIRQADAGTSLALCTVVRCHGSTPQKAGAVLVVLPDGRTLGTIGGGCVEAEVKTRAMRALANAAVDARSQLLTFQLNHDFGWDDGLVCGGTMEIVVERLDSPVAAAPLRAALGRLNTGEPATIEIAATDVDGRVERFSRELPPLPTLVIAGAGHVGQALAAIAGQMDFRVAVIDDRPDMVSAARFPEAKRINGDIEAELTRLRITPHTYIVIVTRGHKNDGRALAAVVRSPAKYIGLIGSRRKIVTIFRDLHQAGVPRELLERVRSPIGLNIGAVSPAEIAVSIAAELIAVRHGAADRPAGPMRLAREIFERVFEEDAST